MNFETALGALANDLRLGALSAAGKPAFAVDGRGAVVWANDVAQSLLGADGIDLATERTLARMAAGGGGLVRLRLGASGRLAPIAMQARPVAGLLVLEGLSAVARPPRPVPAAAERDVASEEGAEAQAGPAQPDDARPEPVEAPATSFVAEAEAASEAVPAEIPEAPFRFTFEFDKDLRLALLSPELGRAVGPSAADAVGRRWSDIANHLGLDPDGAVARALEPMRGWGEITVRWPTADGRRLPIALSALPMFDRGRAFAGYRGLGRSVGLPEAVTPASEAETREPEILAPDMPADEPAPIDFADAVADAASIAASTEAASAAVAADDAPEISAERPAEAPPAPAPVVSPLKPADFAPTVFPANVVSLHDASQRSASLSTSEESAFDEIARRLRSIEALRSDEPRQPPAARRSDAGPVSDARARDAAPDPRADDLFRLLDRLPVGALVLRNGSVEHANRTALDMLGHRDLASLKARPAGSLFAEPPPRDDAAPATLRLIADDGVEVEVEARLSSTAWAGAPATLVSLKRAEGSIATAQAAREREKEIEATLDAAVDGVMTLDGSGRILAVNRGAEALFGFAGRDILGSLFTLSLAPESRRAAFDCLDQVKAGAGVSAEAREVLGLAQHGGAIPLHLTIGRIGGPDAGRFCAVLRDVTEQRRIEEELRVAKRQAERANAQKSDFLAKVSHEIRTPLNAIIGFAEVMMEERFGPVGSPRYKDYLKDIHTSGAHLIGLVDDLLELTRIETGKMKFDFTPVDLNEIAQQAAALLQPQATRGRVIIRTSLARSLPPVLADRRSVRQIMTNLASNAVRFSRPGGQVIVATAMTEHGQAVIRVRDAGLGMSRQELERALEPFRPLAIADNDTGAGLGLPLTKALAEANEAALQLKSEIGRGTLAEVTFPASRVLAG